jgi:hypothetical protein
MFSYVRQKYENRNLVLMRALQQLNPMFVKVPVLENISIFITGP